MLKPGTMPSVGTLRLLLLVCFCATALAFRPLNRLLDVVRSWDQAQSKQSKPERKGKPGLSMGHQIQDVAALSNLEHVAAITCCAWARGQGMQLSGWLRA